MSLEPTAAPSWLEPLYELWQTRPHKLHPDWQAYFAALHSETLPAQAGATQTELLKHSAVQSLIYRYRDIGHLLACTDPLSPCPVEHPLLALESFGLAQEDLGRVFRLRNFELEEACLKDIIGLLRQTYCRSIGAEFMHIQDPQERQWLKSRMESTRNRPALNRKERRALLEKIQQASLFEEFLHRRFPGQKRFSLEGGEILIALLERLVQGAAKAGIEDLVLGMAHRGRLNVLANIFEKPLENIFAEFEDNLEFGFVGDGDVKYHVGFSCKRATEGGELYLTLAPNPSHLEAVDPAVLGKSRARQEDAGREGKKQVLPVLIHGDAAFAGQGMVAEVLNLSGLQGYTTGGTLHIVLNNQIGFTTGPQDARSTCYATDVAKMLMVPIFHVHGEDPEAVVHVLDMALDWRRTFGRDAIVELICYRRQGHNEGDEPMYTQPLMYQNIKDRPRLFEIYEEKLALEGFDAQEMEKSRQRYNRQLEEASSSEAKPLRLGYSGKWEHLHKKFDTAAVKTAVDKEKLRTLGEAICTLPEKFNLHPRLAKLLEKRREIFEQGGELDWAGAEALAFSSLLTEGHSVRLSGQDSRRGTFSQRHSTYFDVEDGSPYCPLAELSDAAPFQAFDSMLSEAAVLGFEYGYSLERPDGLCIWEAQFGDFANGAQVIIDQFIAAGESKWDRSSGLCLFLPHGYEGQGAEHSSARIERFLQLCAEQNLILANPSTPAQFFHLLRRQLKQSFRKPLIIFTPKALLRHPDCVSPLEELSEGGFREILPPAGEPKGVRSLVLCSGRLYYDLEARRKKEQREDLALVRIEQLYPLREDLLRRCFEELGSPGQLIWAQEEPANMGAWSWLAPRLREALGLEPQLVSRKASAASAVGSHRLHKEEQERLLEKLFFRASD